MYTFCAGPSVVLPTRVLSSALELMKQEQVCYRKEGRREEREKKRVREKSGREWKGKERKRVSNYEQFQGYCKVPRLNNIICLN